MEFFSTLFNTILQQFNSIKHCWVLNYECALWAFIKEKRKERIENI